MFHTLHIRMIALLVMLCSFGAPAAELTISAAASLTNAFNALGPAFEAANPGHTVQFNYGASGALLQQIARGAPVDVFASADQETMDQAQQRRLVRADRRRNFVSNKLVLIVPASSAQVPRTLEELNHARYQRVAVGLPASVPVGRYTRGVLEATGQWATIEAKMIGASSVRQVLDYVARNEVDAGFVYATDAALMPNKVKVALAVPTPSPILYPVAPLSASANQALAQRFVEFLLSPRAQLILTEYGFGKP